MAKPRLRGLSNPDVYPSEAVVTADLAAAIVANDAETWEYSVEELTGEDQPAAAGTVARHPGSEGARPSAHLHPELHATLASLEPGMSWREPVVRGWCGGEPVSAAASAAGKGSVD
jgi:hypothetical protein